MTTRFNEMVQLQGSMMRSKNDYRQGQAYFNALEEVDSNLAEKVRGTRLDPFYNDDRIDLFLDYVNRSK